MPGAGKSHMDRTLTRKAVNQAFSELKEKNDGALLSARALKVYSNVTSLYPNFSTLSVPELLKVLRFDFFSDFFFYQISFLCDSYR